MKIFAAVLLAVCMSAGAAQAKVMHRLGMHHHRHMRMAACAEGAVKAGCVCKAASGAQAMRKAGHCCHELRGMCTVYYGPAWPGFYNNRWNGGGFGPAIHRPRSDQSGIAGGSKSGGLRRGTRRARAFNYRHHPEVRATDLGCFRDRQLTMHKSATADLCGAPRRMQAGVPRAPPFEARRLRCLAPQGDGLVGSKIVQSSAANSCFSQSMNARTCGRSRARLGRTR